MLVFCNLVINYIKKFLKQKMSKYIKSDKPLISVVISAYNDLGLMKVLLKKLFQTKYPNFEVVVVDDASLEDLGSLKRFFPIRYFRNPRNLGTAETKNIAARKAKGEILLSLDNDVQPFGDLIWEVYQFFQKNPAALAVTGFPGTGAENPTFFAKYKYLRDWAYWYLESDPDSFYFFRPAIGAIRREVFLKLGGYDSRFCRPKMPAVEDLELSYRLAQLGKIYFDPKLVVGHPFGGIGKLVKTYFQRSGLFFQIIKEKKRFSGVATTKGEAVNIGFALLCFLLLVGCLFFRPTIFVFLPTLAWFIFLQRKFLGLCLRKEGIVFVTGAFLTSWLLYLVIILGAAANAKKIF